MFGKVNSIGLTGLNAFPVYVEIEASAGLPAFDIVGLAMLRCVRAVKGYVRLSARKGSISLAARCL